MRVWEVDDQKAIPSDLVREQDFILRLRRLNRMGTAFFLLELPLSQFDLKAHDIKLSTAQEALQTFATAHNGQYLELSNGDVFLIWTETAECKNFKAKIEHGIFGDKLTVTDRDHIRAFHLPGDYNLLRERANWHVMQAQQNVAQDDKPSQVLHSEAARGPLTAWSVSQIERLLDEISVSRFLRAQPVYQHSEGNWRKIYDELFISFEELKQEHFPRLELESREHLFLEVCQALDRNLLAELTEHFAPIRGQAFSLNISASTVLSSAFVRFAHQVSQIERSRICFELHRGDLFNDFTQTLNAIELLHREHFRVAIDSVTPDALPYLNLQLFDVDLIKLNVAKDRAVLLQDKKIRAALAQIPRERVIFFRCDNQSAYQIGQELGITMYQGWLIDDLAKSHKN